MQHCSRANAVFRAVPPCLGWALIVDWSNNNQSGAEYCSLVPYLRLACGQTL
jgi:hypothetical protein